MRRPQRGEGRREWRPGAALRAPGSPEVPCPAAPPAPPPGRSIFCCHPACGGIAAAPSPAALALDAEASGGPAAGEDAAVAAGGLALGLEI